MDHGRTGWPGKRSSMSRELAGRGLFHRGVAITLCNLRELLHSQQIWFILLFIGTCLLVRSGTVADYAMENNLRTTPFILPVYMTTKSHALNSPKTIVFTGALLLFSDAPFWRRTTPYTVLRSGRAAWCAGELIYIACMALLYTLFIAGVTTLRLLPAADFSDSYRGALTEMAKNSPLWGGDRIDLVLKYFLPNATMFYCMFTGWMAFTFIGVLMYLCGICGGSRLTGIAAAAFFIFLDPVLLYLSALRYYWLTSLSPVCWCSVNLLKNLKHEYFLTTPFVLTAYPLLLGLLSAACMIVSRKTAIKTIGES